VAVTCNTIGGDVRVKK